MLESLFHFLRSLFDPEGLRELIRSGGAPLICGIVFIETGFFVGFFLPGDSLLITAGILAAGGFLPLRWRCTNAKTLSSSAVVICNAHTIFTRSTAAAPLFSRASFPLFEHSAHRLLAQPACPTAAT